MRNYVVATAVFLMVCCNASAQESDDWHSWPLAQRFYVSIEGFFPNLDTTVRLDATDGTTGTVIDFEQNLGMSSTETLPAFGIGWRFARKHRLRFDYFSLKRSGAAISTTEIRFGDQVFQIDLPISSFFDIDSYSFGYSYSPIFDQKKELGLSVGLSVQDVQFGLKGNQGVGIIEAESGITAPLPAIGVDGGYAFTEKWIGRAGVGFFFFDLALSNEQQLSGSITAADVAIFHRTFEHVEFGVKYAYFDVDVEYGNELGFNAVEYRYHGPSLVFAATF